MSWLPGTTPYGMPSASRMSLAASALTHSWALASTTVDDVAQVRDELDVQRPVLVVDAPTGSVPLYVPGYDLL